MCRVKTAFLTATNLAHASTHKGRLETIVENEFHSDIAEWDDAGGDWWRVLPARYERTQKALAQTFHTFVRAYSVAIVSGADREDTLGASCRQLLAMLEERRVGGRVPISAFIVSFQRCPGDVFVHTLALLKWAGHVKSPGTLGMYKYANLMAVKCYTAHQCRKVADPADKVGLRVSCPP